MADARDIRTKDGYTLKNVPYSVPKEQIQARFDAMRQKSLDARKENIFQGEAELYPGVKIQRDSAIYKGLTGAAGLVDRAITSAGFTPEWLGGSEEGEALDRTVAPVEDTPEGKAGQQILVGAATALPAARAANLAVRGAGRVLPSLTSGGFRAGLATGLAEGTVAGAAAGGAGAALRDEDIGEAVARGAGEGAIAGGLVGGTLGVLGRHAKGIIPVTDQAKEVDAVVRARQAAAGVTPKGFRQQQGLPVGDMIDPEEHRLANLLYTTARQRTPMAASRLAQQRKLGARALQEDLFTNASPPGYRPKLLTDNSPTPVKNVAAGIKKAYDREYKRLVGDHSFRVGEGGEELVEQLMRRVENSGVPADDIDAVRQYLAKTLSKRADTLKGVDDGTASGKVLQKIWGEISEMANKPWTGNSSRGDAFNAAREGIYDFISQQSTPGRAARLHVLREPYRQFNVLVKAGARRGRRNAEFDLVQAADEYISKNSAMRTMTGSDPAQELAEKYASVSPKNLLTDPIDAGDRIPRPSLNAHTLFGSAGTAAGLMGTSPWLFSQRAAAGLQPWQKTVSDALRSRRVTGGRQAYLAYKAAEEDEEEEN